MSDTQPIDLISECVRLGRELHSIESQRDALERENAALRERLRDSEHSQSVWMQHAKQSDQKLAAAQQAHLCDLDRRANIAASARKAKDENAELREDKERLDFGCIIVKEMDEMGNFVPVLHKGINLRDAIDAARKEEQP